MCRVVRRHAINRHIQIVINAIKKNKGIESGKFYFKWPDKRNLSEAVVLTEIEFRRESRYYAEGRANAKSLNQERSDREYPGGEEISPSLIREPYT